MATTPDTVIPATTEHIGNDIELCCPGCGVFIAAIEMPTHRLEHPVTVLVRLKCRKCKMRSKRRVTMPSGRHA